MTEILRRFLGFDRLLGPALVKIVYYFGAGVIVLVTLGGVLFAIMSLAADLGAGLMRLLATPAVGAVAFVYWRFLCELFMLAFLAYERLGEVRDLMRVATGQAPAPPDPNHPTF